MNKLRKIAGTLWPVTLFVLAVFMPLEIYRSYKRFKD